MEVSPNRAAAFLASLHPRNNAQRLFAVFIGVLMVSGAGLILTGSLAWLGIPAALLGFIVLLADWRWVYYMLLLTLAFSREISLPGGLSMDVPSEPLMLLLLGCFGVNLLLGRSGVTARYWAHPLVIILGLMLLWASVSAFSSVDSTKSIKYLLAKTWYIGPFVFVTLNIVQRPADLWRLVAFYVVGASVTVVYTAIRHAGHGFAFDAINPSIQPFYLNHVIYAAVLALLLPYTFYAARSTPPGLKRTAWKAAQWLLLFGVLLSYTRASILALPLAGFFYLAIRWRLTALVLIGAAIAALSGALYFVHQNNYMLYAPDYEKTIFYGKDFEKHLEATYKLEDLSGMERLYRWVAAARMISEKPITGSGPATFYPEYKRYTVKSFRTYVSDNPEHSTTHNYFLLQLAEQGLPGFLLFATLMSTALLMVQRLYHHSHSLENRRVVLAAGLSLFIIIFHLLLNEVIEVDKIGSFFFIGLAVLMRAEEWIEKEQLSA
ncbi:O-antigen ligase family protein [Hymenobacter sp. GOD-10R]|uniref:O-antigen ligase family protein n=1 Tax=Hymenobacter sp. GOD-10R TaxID=3093922 RepID=UPI002D7924B6|nr:O-antigen ligase family protein [Hymenobacter sp. GOD-10R]WRQ26937.1 O-antigen ligase family protein [Hymenobacter sp. GOD-10R]